MYEVSKNYYMKFLPAVIKAAEQKSQEMKLKYEKKIDAMFTQEEHLWKKGLSPEEVEELRKTYQERYSQ